MLRLTDLDTPMPGDGQVLVKVRAVSLNASDWEMLRGKPLYSRIGGPFRPRHHVLGSDIAGRVAATGRNVTRFRPGDDVFADVLSSMGGFAEYVCVPQAALAPMPAGLSYEQAAALPQAGAIALQGIRDKGRVRPGQLSREIGASTHNRGVRPPIDSADTRVVTRPVPRYRGQGREKDRVRPP